MFVELPDVETDGIAGEEAGVVESVKAASDIYSPADGEVLEVNASLSSEPALVNTSPYENGWLYKMRLSNPSQLDTLKSPDDYRTQIG